MVTSPKIGFPSTPKAKPLSLIKPGSCPAGFTKWSNIVSPFRTLVAQHSHPSPFKAARFRAMPPTSPPSGEVTPSRNSPSGPNFAVRLTGPLVASSSRTGDEQEIPVKREPETDDDAASIREDPDSLEEGEVRESPMLASLPPQTVRLGSIDLNTLHENLVLLYFGVLAIQNFLLPRFQYSLVGRRDLWGVKLTVYGHTILARPAHTSQMEAKVEVCRAALQRLSAENLRWIVPREPTVDGTEEDTFDWVSLLHNHCVHNGLPLPTYTKCVYDGDGYCFEIELQGATYSGPVRHYRDDRGARNSAAHRTLHALLVFGNGDDSYISGPATLAKFYEDLLPEVSRAATSRSSTTLPAPRHGTSDTDLSTDRARKRRKRESHSQQEIPIPRSPSGGKKKTATTTTTTKKKKPANSNLLPLVRNRLPVVEVHVEKEPSKWRCTRNEIRAAIESLPTYSDRLSKTCQMLCLEPPEIRVERRLDGRLVDADEGLYNAAAYFRHDPFLTRVGAIGRVENEPGTRRSVTESCARRAVVYLLRVVDEDTALEEENTEQRARRDQWCDLVRKSSGMA
ncbi:hypothetical protein BDV59DRAFT_197720 [Aspergillus ambiguus]|uniref:uncharacterized protein n=1 Tax=Aspergillus ambiguus TaxID=176160 RepID=UPI003CCDE08D